MATSLSGKRGGLEAKAQLSATLGTKNAFIVLRLLSQPKVSESSNSLNLTEVFPGVTQNRSWDFSIGRL